MRRFFLPAPAEQKSTRVYDFRAGFERSIHYANGNFTMKGWLPIFCLSKFERGRDRNHTPGIAASERPVDRRLHLDHDTDADVFLHEDRWLDSDILARCCHLSGRSERLSQQSVW